MDFGITVATAADSWKVVKRALAPVAANCLASLNKLAPGRIHCGIATGFTAAP